MAQSTDNTDVKKYDYITVSKIPEKYPDPKENFKCVKDQDLAELSDDQVLVELHDLSVDPYLRGRLPEFQDPKPMNGFGVGKVLKIGKNVKNLIKGDFVFGGFPWSTYFNINSKQCFKIPSHVPSYNSRQNDEDSKSNDDNNKMVDITSIPKSYFIGGYGMPGQTAYYGLYQHGKLKNTDTVLVSGGAGAVGSMVGQLAKLKGCKKIIGSAGSKEKLDFMKSIGFTDVINYKEVNGTEAMQAKLKEILGDKGGIDVYYDNTGGDVTNAQWGFLNPQARVIVCGQISQYNAGKDVTMVPAFLGLLVYKEVMIKGITWVNMTQESKMQFYGEIGPSIVDKSITLRETIVKGGIEQAPQAFCNLFKGTNIGKMIVQIKSD